jgi:hypothetical protein
VNGIGYDATVISRATIELEAKLRATPDDLALVEALWSSLLNDGEPADAQRWLTRLAEAWQATQPYRVLRLHEDHAAGGGDPGPAAELRRALGLDFAFEELSAADATQRLALRAPGLAPRVRLERRELGGDPVRWVEGDLRLPHLEMLGAPPLVVAGALEVAGAVVDSLDPLSVTVVLGALRCRHAVLRGEWHVAGDVDVRGLLYLCSGNDYVAEVGGDVRVDVLIEDGTRFAIAGELIGRRLISRHNEVTSRAGVLRHRDLDDVTDELEPAVFDDGSLSVERLVRAAREDRPLLAADGRIAPGVS